MQIYGILLRFRGIFTENAWKIEENAWKIEENTWKIGEFPRNPFLEVAEPKGDPAVVSGRFQSFSVIFGRFLRHSWI